MAEAPRLRLYSIPPHRAFADALANGLLRQYGRDPMALARGFVLLPNNRAKRAITDAFVRASGGGLLMPRLVAVGDPEIDEAVGPFADPADDLDPIPPAVAPLARRMILSRLVAEERARAARPVDAAEAVRLAGDLARTLDQLLVEEIEPDALKRISFDEPLQTHWERSLAMFETVLVRWPRELEALGCIDLAVRRRRLLDRLIARWRATPPAGFVCAAGIASASPVIARLLRAIAELPQGSVVLSGLAIDMDDAEWDLLGPHEPDPVTGRRRRALETHPQFQLKLLLDRMGVGRREFETWRAGSEHDAKPARSRTIESALAPAERTHDWIDLPVERRSLAGVQALDVPTPAEEAQAIAIALRQALETEGKTAALVTPDRALARRVSAHCARWGITVDDTAGQPLSVLPPGTMLLALADVAAQDFAPLPLLALLKHPLACAEEGRLEWLEGVRRLDRALRGPRPAPGLAGLDAFLADTEGREGALRRAAAPWWEKTRPLLAALSDTYSGGRRPLPDLLGALRAAATALGGDALWSRPEGRAAAELLDTLEQEAVHGPALVEPESIGPMLRTLMDEVAVRPPHGGHPRLSIYGLLEAQLQTSDLTILGGLNEGVWPGLPSPDPWLAPRIRAELGLPGLERRIGLAAHDLANSLGAKEVLLTRAHRDASGPTVASRFWLRLEALSVKGLDRAEELARWTHAIDDPGGYDPAQRPAPCPPVALRPRQISVTEVDRLKADPFAFYARRMLRLAALDPVDADPSAAWRGTAVHGVLEDWARQDGFDPAKLSSRVETLAADPRTHPLLRALWVPRLREAVDWIAGQVAAQMAGGRSILGVEGEGKIQLAGVELRGKFDRIDRLDNGELAVVDYKTGQPPSTRAVRDGFSLQLGLLGIMAERGAFEGIAGTATAFEYWSLAKRDDKFGYVATPVDPAGSRNRIPTDRFVALALHHFTEAAGNWLTGEAPFTAKLKPEYAPFAEYDQLMRRDEWYGRE
ncbi:double-strand break repair protein AddB [Sphingomonas desiccabilis]|uniref:Double-strand break repair protein AddB n=1 Tax=Sphingomonas desiccabilis TaxID=429134 RepID=A0A4Q2IVY4_9SPHN|nr:double-strand break repair protein AddB [Sphingomonas desiccabilis]MBB3909926.1 ATP-dependent helicase/nuclease subunit B [Sphingomonas desiccabilis]RXZ34596.1 double-strand break repair protein AddB [Sphingomonas desiccabilis]